MLYLFRLRGRTGVVCAAPSKDRPMGATAQEKKASAEEVSSLATVAVAFKLSFLDNFPTVCPR